MVTVGAVRHVTAARLVLKICIDIVRAVYANVENVREYIYDEFWFYANNLIENDGCENGGFVVGILAKIDIIGKLIWFVNGSRWFDGVCQMGVYGDGAWSLHSKKKLRKFTNSKPIGLFEQFDLELTEIIEIYHFIAKFQSKLFFWLDRIPQCD
jgi:hypothetical protein